MERDLGQVVGFLIVGVVIAAIFSFSILRTIPVDAGSEAVLVKKPWIFGDGGVVDIPLKTGLHWGVKTTDRFFYSVKPEKVKESFVDLTASDNVAIDFDMYLTTEIKSGHTPILHEKFGVNWYNNNIKDVFRKLVRNEARTRTSIDLRINEDVINDSESKITEALSEYVSSISIPIKINKVVIGKVIPPEEVLLEAERTASQKQRLKTQEMIQKAEEARKGAEEARALADRAYIKELGINNEQYIKLRELEVVNSKKDVSIYYGVSPLPIKQMK